MKIAKTAAAKRATEDLEKRNSQQRTTTVGVESESITLHQDYFLAPGVKRGRVLLKQRMGKRGTVNGER